MRLLAGLVCTGLAGAFAFSQASAQEITLRIADNLPPTHFLARYGTNHFMDEVTKATGGQIKFQHFPSEQLGKAKDMLTLLQSGLADITLVVPSYMSEKLPVSGVIDLPGGTKSSCEGTMAYWSLLQEGGFLSDAEFKANKVRPVFVYVNPPYELFLSKPGRVNVLDFEGRKIRSVGGALDLTVRELKGSPVRLSAPEIRESLSRGTVDGIIFPVPTVVSYKLEELIKSATRGARLSSVATGYMISEAAWAKLPESARKAIERVGLDTTKRVCELTDKDVSKTYDEFQKQGIETTEVSADELKALEPVFKKVRQDWAAQLDQRGKPGSAALAAFDKALAATH